MSTFDSNKELVKYYRTWKDDIILLELTIYHEDIIHSLAMSFASRYRMMKQVDIVVQAGIRGLFHAILVYDISSNTSFSGFALPFIRRHMLKVCVDKKRARTTVVRTHEKMIPHAELSKLSAKSRKRPPSSRAQVVSLKQAHHTIETEISELWDKMFLHFEFFSIRRGYDLYVGFLNKIALDDLDDDYFVNEHKAAEDVVDVALKNVQIHELRAALATLSVIERQIVTARHGFAGKTMSTVEMATMLSLSEFEVRLHENRAMAKLRAQLKVQDS